MTFSAGVSEVQKLTLNSSMKMPYVLSFDGVNTIELDFETAAIDLQKALNDLPTLAPNLVTVAPVSSNDETIKIFRVTFSVDLGDVPDLVETSGNVIMEVLEETTGVASGSKVQLGIEDKFTPLFDLRDNDASVKFALNLRLNFN